MERREAAGCLESPLYVRTRNDRFALLNRRRLSARLDVAQTAAIPNCREHDIPLTRAKMLGKPAADWRILFRT